MRKVTVLSIILLSLGLAQAQPLDLAAGVTIGGYNFGLSLEFNAYAQNIGGSAFGARLGFGFSFTDAFEDDNAFYGGSGAAPDASLDRISDYKDSANFDTSESGRNFTMSLDGTFDLSEVFSMDGLPFTASVYAGPRLNFFSGSFEVDDGIASVSSSQFGLGFGSLAFYPLSDNLSLVGDIGADIYFDSTLNLDDDFGDLDVEPSDTAYDDYDGLINQPSLAIKVKVGVVYSF
ncbi:MAG: hypothetical protein AAF708_08040 [Deinococcota bacterium]